jgi:hypothetical protein
MALIKARAQLRASNSKPEDNLKTGIEYPSRLCRMTQARPRSSNSRSAKFGTPEFYFFAPTGPHEVNFTFHFGLKVIMVPGWFTPKESAEHPLFFYLGSADMVVVASEEIQNRVAFLTTRNSEEKCCH